MRRVERITDMGEMITKQKVSSVIFKGGDNMTDVGLYRRIISKYFLKYENVN